MNNMEFLLFLIVKTLFFFFTSLSLLHIMKRRAKKGVTALGNALFSWPIADFLLRFCRFEHDPYRCYGCAGSMFAMRNPVLKCPSKAGQRRGLM